MSSKKLLSVVCAMSLLTASAVSVAAPHDDEPQRHKSSQQQKHSKKSDSRSSQNRGPSAQTSNRDTRGPSQASHRDSRGSQQRSNYRESSNQVTRHDDRARGHQQRGPQPREDWKRGDRIPNDYRDSRYYVNDWRDRHLPSPPRNHRWIEVNGDYVLVAIATGVITSILIGHDY